MKTFTDERGTITDLLVTPDYSITHITFKEGAVRGNHYHEHTTQYDFVLKGSFTVASRPKDKDGEEFKLFRIVNTGELLIHYPNMAHAYQAIGDAELLSTCYGVRKGEDYEKDVIRLPEDKKLL